MNDVRSILFLLATVLTIPFCASVQEYRHFQGGTRQFEGVPQEEGDPYLQIHPDHLVQQILDSIELLQDEISFDRPVYDPARLLRLAIAFEELSRYYLARERVAYDEAMAACLQRGAPACHESITPDFSRSDACVEQALILYEDVLAHFPEHPAAFEAWKRAAELRKEMSMELFEENHGGPGDTEI